MSGLRPIRIGITSIGSGVGQSVADACRLSGLPMQLVGMGYTPFAFGGFDCDLRAELPDIHDSGYVDRVLERCREHRLDILIPGLDDELLPLARNRTRFAAAGVEVIVAGERMLELCRDKACMSRELASLSPAVLETLDVETGRELATAGKLEFPLIAKPRAGFASRGVHVINGVDDLRPLTRDHILQTVAVPRAGDPNRAAFLHALRQGRILQVSEISAQIVIGRDGTELGRVVTCNRLAHGVPVEVIPVDAPEIRAAIDRLLPTFLDMGLRGPLNLQGRLTDDGPKFFEMNARFTGITGLRAMAGFNEVEAVILDALGQRPRAGTPTFNPRRIGLRQVANRVVDISLDRPLEKAAAAIGPHPSGGRTVLVTGANSYFGRAVVDRLLATAGIGKVIALVRDPARFNPGEADALPEGSVVRDLSDLWHGALNLGGVDVLVHLASGRPVHDGETLADSLRLTRDLMNLAARFQVPGIVNASSQAVYGRSRPPLWREDMAPIPETPYAQAKWASELMAAMPGSLNRTTAATSIRLAQLIGPGTGLRFTEVPHLFMRKALAGETITLQGGRQEMDYLDVRDAARLVADLCARPFAAWPAVINAGSGQPVSLAYFSAMANAIARETFGRGTRIETVPADLDWKIGMDISMARHHLGWMPEIDLATTLRDIGVHLLGSHRPGRH